MQREAAQNKSARKNASAGFAVMPERKHKSFYASAHAKTFVA
jgi:hypothetical protein